MIWDLYDNSIVAYKTAILFHNFEYCLRVSLDISIPQPLSNLSVAIGGISLILTFFYSLCYVWILLRSSQLLYKVIVTTAGYFEKLTHNSYCIYPSDDRLPHTLALAPLSFCGVQKIPQKLILLCS